VSRFWRTLDSLVASSRVLVERPAGSAHPRYPALIYPLDYGCLESSRASDGDPVDVWLGSLADRRVGAVITTVDLHKRDVETKLLLGCTASEMDMITAFHNQGGQAGRLLRRA
jgi:inorganic pyrophosphatase